MVSQLQNRKPKKETGTGSQRLNNNRGVINPRGIHVQCQNPRNTFCVFSPDGVPEKFQG